MKAALFVTCLTDTFYPRAAIAVVKVLERLGCEVSFPAGQTCCGQPFWNNGYHDEARPLAKRMIELFESSEAVVTPSGSCAAMIREYYPALLEGEGEWGQRAASLVSRTYEFVEFLVKVLKVDVASLGVKWEGEATYHYSCHLRGLGMREETPRLLERIEGLTYRVLPHAEECCGFGGTFAAKFAGVSGNMAREKVRHVRETGAETLVVNDAGCMLNISGACHREGAAVSCRHVAEILAEGMGLLPRGEGEGKGGAL